LCVLQEEKPVFLFSFHFLLSLKLFMSFKTCNFLFLTFRHCLITNSYHGVAPLYKNIAVFSNILDTALENGSSNLKAYFG